MCTGVHVVCMWCACGVHVQQPKRELSMCIRATYIHEGGGEVEEGVGNIFCTFCAYSGEDTIHCVYL